MVGRCIQGVGGGGISAITEVLIADLVPMRYRGQYYGLMNAMWSVGSVTGPIIGGAFAGDASWVRNHTAHALLFVPRIADIFWRRTRDGYFTSTSLSSALAFFVSLSS